MSATPLAGLRVLEFTHTVMGPTAGLIFAELGADVIKVEPAPQGDHTRGLGGFGAGFFAAFNRNKRSLAVDLKRPEGQAIIHRLVPTTDIVIENYGPGTMERLGVGWEQLSPLNPRLIYLALKGYLAGPYEHRPALDEVVQFQSGLAFMTGPPGRPLRAGASVIDIMGAMFGVIAVQAALRERDATGQRPARIERAVRERRVSDEHAYGRDGGDRARRAADADPARRLGDLRGLRHAGRPALYRRHQRPAMGALCRGIFPSGTGRRPAARDQRRCGWRSGPG